MLAHHYRLSAAIAASLSLTLAACSSTPQTRQPAPPAPAAKAAPGKQAAATTPTDDIDTEATIWTVLGLAKEQSYRAPGPQTGTTVSPVLYQAARDTLDFVRFASEDPIGGSLVTDWYTPKEKPDERFRVDVFILSRYLNSDSVAVTVIRQVRGPNGQWVEAPIARQVASDLENKILYRARQLRRSWIAQSQS